MNEKIILDEVTNLFHCLGMQSEKKAVAYLKSSILFACLDASVLHNMRKGVYTKVAEQYMTLPEKVERSIRSVIETTWNHGNPNSIYSVFQNTIDKERAKPTNREFIMMMVDIIRIRKL